MMLEIEKKEPTEPSGEDFFEDIPRSKIEVSEPKPEPEKPAMETPQEITPETPVVKKEIEDTSEDGLITDIFELYKSKGGEVIDDPEWIEKMDSLGEIIISQTNNDAKRLKLVNETTKKIIEKSNGQLTEGFLTNELTKAINRIKQKSQE